MKKRKKMMYLTSKNAGVCLFFIWLLRIEMKTRYSLIFNLNRI